MKCPECDEGLNISIGASVGEIIAYPSCDTDFEISRRDSSNVELKQAESVGKDWGG